MLCKESNAKLRVKGFVSIFTIQSTMAILRFINDDQHDGQYRAIIAVRVIDDGQLAERHFAHRGAALTADSDRGRTAFAGGRRYSKDECACQCDCAAKWKEVA